MSMNTLGNKLRATVFGQSHAAAIGCVVEGLPTGFRPDMDRVAAFMARGAGQRLLVHQAEGGGYAGDPFRRSRRRPLRRAGVSRHP